MIMGTCSIIVMYYFLNRNNCLMGRDILIGIYNIANTSPFIVSRHSVQNKFLTRVHYCTGSIVNNICFFFIIIIIITIYLHFSSRIICFRTVDKCIKHEQVFVIFTNILIRGEGQTDNIKKKILFEIELYVVVILENISVVFACISSVQPVQKFDLCFMRFGNVIL